MYVTNESKSNKKIIKKKKNTHTHTHTHTKNDANNTGFGAKTSAIESPGKKKKGWKKWFG